MKYTVYYAGFGKIHHAVEVDAEDENDAISKANEAIEERDAWFKLVGLCFPEAGERRPVQPHD